MVTPDISLITSADATPLERIDSADHPIISVQAQRAGLPRSMWNEIPGPVEGRGIEHWYRDGNGALAYTREEKGRMRLVIFDAVGKALADVRHIIRHAA